MTKREVPTPEDPAPIPPPNSWVLCTHPRLEETEVGPHKANRKQTNEQEQETGRKRAQRSTATTGLYLSPLKRLEKKKKGTCWCEVF